MKRINEIGNRYGKLSVIERVKNKGTQATWKCKCDCGNETIVRGGNLRSGNNKSCGCLYETAEILGQRYGKLIVIKRVGQNKHGLVLWECQCDCGNKTVVSGVNLRRNSTKSCGCVGTYKLPKGRAAFNDLFGKMKKSAKKREYKWELSSDQVEKLVNKPCFYCGILHSNTAGQPKNNGNYKYNGLDRINNNKGYAIDNVVSCCVNCNKAKLTKDISEFLDWLKRLAIYNRWDCNINTIKFKEIL